MRGITKLFSIRDSDDHDIAAMKRQCHKDEEILSGSGDHLVYTTKTYFSQTPQNPASTCLNVVRYFVSLAFHEFLPCINIYLSCINYLSCIKPSIHDHQFISHNSYTRIPVKERDYCGCMEGFMQLIGDDPPNGSYEAMETYTQARDGYEKTISV
jgi:hypothetical protein